jgi:hypothetical protein
MTPVLQASCLDALVDAASEVASTVLAGASFEALREGRGYGSGHGAYLSLVAPEESLQVGLLVEPEGCQVLAKALLGMEPGDEDLPPGDVSDAMCEIINIVAGGLKRRVADNMPLTLGLPMFVSGHPLPNQQQEVVSRSLKISEVTVSIILLTQKNHAVARSRSSNSLQPAVKLPAKEHTV